MSVIMVSLTYTKFLVFAPIKRWVGGGCFFKLENLGNVHLGSGHVWV